MVAVLYLAALPPAEAQLLLLLLPVQVRMEQQMLALLPHQVSHVQMHLPSLELELWFELLLSTTTVGYC